MRCVQGTAGGGLQHGGCSVRVCVGVQPTGSCECVRCAGRPAGCKCVMCEVAWGWVLLVVTLGF